MVSQAALALYELGFPVTAFWHVTSCWRGEAIQDNVLRPVMRFESSSPALVMYLRSSTRPRLLEVSVLQHAAGCRVAADSLMLEPVNHCSQRVKSWTCALALSQQ